MISALVAMVALGGLRCLAVERGYSSFCHRLFTACGKKENDDSRWAEGEAATHSRQLMLVFLLVLAFLQVLEGRVVLLSAMPAVISMVALEMFDSFESGRGRTRARDGKSLSLKERNERSRWLYRTGRWVYASYVQVCIMDDILSLDHLERHVRRGTYLRAIVSFALFRDLEEILFETSQPLVVAWMYYYRNAPGGAADQEKKNAMLFNSLVSFAKASVFVAIPTALQLRGAVTRLMFEKWRTNRRGGGTTIMGRARKMVNFLVFPHPVGAVILFATMMLSGVAIGSVGTGGGDVRSRTAVDPRPVGLGFLIAALFVRYARLPHPLELERRMSKFYEWEAEEGERRGPPSGLLSLSCAIATIAMFWVRLDFRLALGFALACVVMLRCKMHDAVRSFLLASRVITLMAKEGEIIRMDGATFLLVTARLLLSFESRPIADLLADSLLSSGLTCLLLSRGVDFATLNAVQLSIVASLFAALGNQASRFQAFELTRVSRGAFFFLLFCVWGGILIRLMKEGGSGEHEKEGRGWFRRTYEGRADDTETESQAHLDHAIKQKLAGVSSAVESCMETMSLHEGDSSNHPIASRRRRSQAASLMEIMRETYVLTRRHHDACHLLNLVSFLDRPKGSKSSNRARAAKEDKSQERDAKAIVEDWQRRMLYVGVELEAGGLELPSPLARGDNVAEGEPPASPSPSPSPSPKMMVTNRFVMNWDLAYFLVFSLLDDFSSVVRRKRGGRNVKLELSYEEDLNSQSSSSSLVLKMERGFTWGGYHEGPPRIQRGVQVRWLAKELSAEFKSPNVLIIPVEIRRVPLPLFTPAYSPSVDSFASTSTAASNSPSPTPKVEKNLTFGVLDDVALVRMATVSFLIREFQAHPSRTFACGASRREAEVTFFQLVKERKPDIVILDYYFDFPIEEEEEEEDEEEEEKVDEAIKPAGSLRAFQDKSSSSTKGPPPDIGIINATMISGMDLARRLREGECRFEGLIFIHTANEGVREELDYHLVDGFLSKSFNKASYERAICEAMERRRRRRRSAGCDYVE